MPKTNEPFLNVTVPLGEPPKAPVTVAVKVTDWPEIDGFRDEVMVEVVFALLTEWPNTAEVLPLKLELPA